jgi:hypothetical protein
VTAALHEATGRLVHVDGPALHSIAMEVIVVVLVIALLVEVEMLRAHGGRRALAVARSLAIATTPLLVAFVLIVGARLAQLVR